MKLQQSFTYLQTQALALLAGCLLAHPLGAVSLEDFGYGRLAPNATTGARHVAVVLMQYDSAPVLKIPVASPLVHDSSFYYHLFFDFTQQSANGYYMEVSHGLLHLVPAGSGVYGPFSATGDQWDAEDPNDKSMKHLTLALQKLAGAGFNFADYDYDGNGVVDQTELTVVIIDNVSGIGGVNRRGNPACFTPDGQNVQVCLNMVAFGDRASFMTLCHEISHQMGTIDLYGASGGENFEYTLMGATQFENADGSPINDDTRMFHLDPWHKMLLGWTQPAMYSLDANGTATLNSTQLMNGDPIILYSDSKGPLEFFMLEFRNGRRPGGASYDHDVNMYGNNHTGVVIWHVATQGKGGALGSDVYPIPAWDVDGDLMDSVFMIGGPSGYQGGGDLWNPGAITLPLLWLDKAGPFVKVKVGAVSNNGDSIQVYWGDHNYIDPPPPPPIPMALFIYDMHQTSGATGYISDADAMFNQMQGFASGSLGSWTNLVSLGSEMFCYNAHNGAAAIGEMDAAGNFKITHGLSGFSAGWTHIVLHKGYLFFYNMHNGIAAVGALTNGVFHQYNSWTSFSAGWTSVVSTPNGLLFYSQLNGSGAVGDWNVISTGSGFGIVTRVDFKQTASYPYGSFNLGWTHIVNTNNGVLFYDATSGLQVMVDVLSNGSVSTRSRTIESLRPGWTHIVSDDTNLLFYDSNSGEVSIADIAKTASLPNSLFPHPAGAVVFRRNLGTYFSAGWTHIVSIAPVAAIK